LRDDDSMVAASPVLTDERTDGSSVETTQHETNPASFMRQYCDWGHRTGENRAAWNFLR